MATAETITPKDRLLRVAADAVTVAGTGDTAVVTLDVTGYTKLCYHFAVATQNVDNTDVLVKAHPTAASQDVTPSDWTSLAATSRFKYASGNLNSVTATATGYFEMDVTGLSTVVVEHSAAADSASVTPYYTLR